METPKFQRIRDFLHTWGWPLLALVAVLAFFTPLLLKWSWYGKGDWGYFHFLDAVARRTLLDFGELPEWNPYQCGGNVLAANTQAHIWSPWVLFPLALGPAAGAKVAAGLHALIGAAGMWVLLGAMGVRRSGRFLGTVLFVGSGFFGHQIAGGHVWAWPFYYVPLVLHFLLRGCYELKWAALAGLFWGLMAMEGGVYPAPYTGVLVGAVLLAMLLGWTPLEGRSRARWWLPLAAFGVCVAVFLLIGAVKLLPDLFHMAAHPRRVPDYDRIDLATLLDTFTGRNWSWGWDRHSHHHYLWWGEYGNYVGWAGLALAAGAVVTRFRRARVPLVFLAGCLALTLGHLGPGAPWDLLHRLPVFENLRVPSRFTIFSSLVLAYLAGLALSEGETWLRARLTGRWTRRLALALPVLVAVGVAADVLIMNAHPFWPQLVEPPPAPDQPPAAMVQLRGTYKRMYDHVARNNGTLLCQEINSIPRSPRVKQQDAEYGVIPPEDGSTRLIDWSPNQINLEVDLKRDAILWVNQNYHEGWSASVGKVQPLEDQLTVQLPAGRRRVRLVYRAPGLRPGLALTGVGLLLVAGWFGGDRWWRRRRRAAGSSGKDGTPPPGGASPPIEPTRDRAPPAGEAPAATAPGSASVPATVAPQRFTRRWWLRVFAPNAAFAAVSLTLLFGSLLIAEPGDAVWTAEVHEYIRPRFRDGDLIQFNLGWVGDPLRRFQGLDQLGPNLGSELVEGGWRRLWYVFCRRDGDARKLKDVLGRYAELGRRDIGHYTVYLLAPENAERLVYLQERLAQARARIVPREGEAQACASRDGGPPLVCGPKPYQEVRASKEKSGLQLRRCVWIHPLPDDAETEVTFPGLLDEVESTFVFRYGLTDAAVTAKTGGPVVVTVSAGDVRLRRIVAQNAVGWFHVELTVPPDAPGDLVVGVHAERAGARHFCVGGSFERKGTDGP